MAIRKGIISNNSGYTNYYYQCLKDDWGVSPAIKRNPSYLIANHQPVQLLGWFYVLDLPLQDRKSVV